MTLTAVPLKITSETQNKQEKDQSILGLLSAFLLIVFTSFSVNPKDKTGPVAFSSSSLPQARKEGWYREPEHKIAVSAKNDLLLIAS